MRRPLSSVIAALTLLALSAQVVSADAVLADGDGVGPLARGAMNLGRVCHAETATATALIAVRATGHPNRRNVFDNGASVTTSAVALSGAGLAAASAAPVISLDAGWRGQPDETLSAAATWEVSVTPDAVGRYRGQVEFRAVGLNRLGETITRVGRMNVVARVLDCAAPVLGGLPTDLVVEATGPDGADLVWVPPTATDAVDGSVAVDCDLPASARLPFGVTVVTCTTSDAAGNEARGSFTVTVADTTAPAVDGAPLELTAIAPGPDGATVAWPEPTAMDVVDGALPVTCDPASGSLFPIGSTRVTCTVADAAGNVASVSFGVEVSIPAPVDANGERPPRQMPAADPGTPTDAQQPQAQAPAPEPESAAVAPAVMRAEPAPLLPDTGLTPSAPSPVVLGGLGLVLLAGAQQLRRRIR